MRELPLHKGAFLYFCSTEISLLGESFYVCTAQKLLRIRYAASQGGHR